MVSGFEMLVFGASRFSSHPVSSSGAAYFTCFFKTLIHVHHTTVVVTVVDSLGCSRPSKAQPLDTRLLDSLRSSLRQTLP